MASLPNPSQPTPSGGRGFSPLVMSDRLIAMAMDADGRGDSVEALQWLSLAHQVLDRPASAATSMPVRGSSRAQ